MPRVIQVMDDRVMHDHAMRLSECGQCYGTRGSEVNMNRER